MLYNNIKGCHWHMHLHIAKIILTFFAFNNMFIYINGYLPICQLICHPEYIQG